MKPPTVRAAGGIVCRIRPDKEIEVLLVGGTHREPDHWSFPKGRQDPGEPIEMTALREVREETGFDVELIALVGINAYKFASAEYGALRDKTVRLFLARIIGGDVSNRDAERLDVRWLPFNEAHRRLKYIRDRELLLDAQQIIKHNAFYRELLKEQS
jgi:8-oxo-dGTP pyrophosphatase MutT (NUDIX family)